MEEYYRGTEVVARQKYCFFKEPLPPFFDIGLDWATV
jgi:hypothetical protein